MNQILIVEDEVYLSRFIEMELQHEGYTVTIANDGQDGYNKALENDFDLILLDIMLPGMNGLEFCRKLRQRSETPIIMLTAKDEIMDKVTGLDIGANDYITKPFAIEEVLARIRAVIRSGKNKEQDQQTELSIQDLRLNPTTFQVYRGNREIKLTKKEFLLLKTLMENKNVVMTREKLLRDVWNESFHEDSNVVDVFIRYLRNKIEEKGSTKMISTIRGVGYVIRED